MGTELANFAGGTDESGVWAPSGCRRAFAAMMTMRKIDIAAIEAAVRG